MSYERDIQHRCDTKEGLPGKLDISLLKYFWQASPFFGTRKDTVPKFLRRVKSLDNFNDLQLHTLSKYLHSRTFKDGESIFRQYDSGFGFYLIFSGNAVVHVNHENSENKESPTKKILTLSTGEYFGELALLQQDNIRSASMVADGPLILLGVFKPDLEELINDHPVVANRFLQSISGILSNRLYSITREVVELKDRIKELERSNES